MFIRLKIQAKLAKNGPPLSAILGQCGIAIPKFIQEFNEVSKSLSEDLCISVNVFSLEDGNFNLVVKGVFLPKLFLNLNLNKDVTFVDLYNIYRFINIVNRRFVNKYKVLKASTLVGVCKSMHIKVCKNI